MAKRRVTGRGRAWVAIGLVLFLAITSSMVVRRSVGSARARALQQLGEKSATLDAERTRLVALIRHETSRAVLTPVALRLGLSTPNDSRVINLGRAPTR